MSASVPRTRCVSWRGWIAAVLCAVFVFAAAHPADAARQAFQTVPATLYAMESGDAGLPPSSAVIDHSACQCGTTAPLPALPVHAAPRLTGAAVFEASVPALYRPAGQSPPAKPPRVQA